MRSLLAKLPGPLLIALCAVLWSSGGLFIKLVDAPPLAIAGARSTIAALLILAWLKKPRFSFAPAQIGAAAANALTMLLFVYANKATSSANAILLQYASPVWTALMAAAFLKERVRTVDWCALALVAGGMALFFVGAPAAPGALLGDLAAIASGVSFAAFFVLMRRQKDGSPLESLLLAHVMVALAGIPAYPALALGGTNLLGILLLGLFQIGAAAILFSEGIKRTTAIQTSFITMIEPALNPAWVLLATGEAPTALAVAGGAVIVGAVTLASAWKRKRAG